MLYCSSIAVTCIMRNAVVLLHPKYAVACYNIYTANNGHRVRACVAYVCACVVYETINVLSCLFHGTYLNRCHKNLCNEVNHTKTSHDRFREVICIAATSLMRSSIFGPQVTALDRCHCTVSLLKRSYIRVVYSSYRQGCAEWNILYV